MTNRQLFTYKFKSSRLKEFHYDVSISFKEAKSFNELVAIADNQILRSIRDIRKRTIHYHKLEKLYRIRDAIKKRTNKSQEGRGLRDLLVEVQSKIERTLFVFDYITIVMEHPTHYKYIFENGVKINGKVYKRFSCSAGQARSSTVVLCNTEIINELGNRLNNGRNMDAEMAPSKFNAYFGLAGTATQIVSEPKFIVVKDFVNEATFTANFIIETDEDLDDEIEVRDVTVKMNRTDGMGLVSPKQAKKWADELELDYTPSQFCIRQNFIKGMLCTFPIHEFCEEVNSDNYMVDTIYKDQNGDCVKVDIRDFDVVITESQFKLWHCYPNIDAYIENCHKNNLFWGISHYTPRVDKDVLRLNYQFLQTLKLDQEGVERLASQFVKWIHGVSYHDVSYMLLFLLGVNNTEDKIKRFLRHTGQYGENYWLKCLIINPELKNDKYIKGKIRKMLRNRIQKACMGEIFVDGNFQVLVSDPYGFMQHVCGLEVTGLLKDGEFYSNYWNGKSVTTVDAMRSPLTFVSEHVVLNFVKNEDTEKWYRYCKSGIILNYHGHETVNFAGADFDYDILATTSNPLMINGVYGEEHPVVYDPPKPKKMVFCEEDLYRADLFSFGSAIGSITNKSSNAYALLPNLEKGYGKESREYRTTYSRLMQCCKAQSAQIDKAKIGRKVKGIPEAWVNYKKASDTEDSVDEVKEKQFFNSILLNKNPYFFKYRYPKHKKAYDDYVERNEATCFQKFKKPIKDLLNSTRKTPEEKEFTSNYFKYMPLTFSDNPVNMLCYYIENINFDINKKTRSPLCADEAILLKNNSISYTEEQKKRITDVVRKYAKDQRFEKSVFADQVTDFNNNDASHLHHMDGGSTLEDRLNEVTNDYHLITNCLVDYYYVDNPKSNKDLLWTNFGKYLFQNVKRNTDGKASFPFPSNDGDIEYMGKKYALKEVGIY